MLFTTTEKERVLNNVELQYKRLKYLADIFCQDFEYRSTRRLHRLTNELVVFLDKNFFLWKQCPKISRLLFKDGADRRMKIFFL